MHGSFRAVRNSFALGAALVCLVGTTSSRAQEPDLSGMNLDFSLLNFDGLSGPQSSSTDPFVQEATAACAEYLQYNLRLNPDQIFDHCRRSELTVAHLETASREMRVQKRSCTTVAQLKARDLEFRNMGTQGNTGSGGGGSADVGVGLVISGGSVRMRFKTPWFSLRRTLSSAPKSEGSGWTRREQDPFLQRNRDFQSAVRRDLKNFDARGAVSRLNGEDVGSYIAYQGMRSAYRSALSNSDSLGRQKATFAQEAGECERYFTNRNNEVLAELGSRR